MSTAASTSASHGASAAFLAPLPTGYSSQDQLSASTSLWESLLEQVGHVSGSPPPQKLAVAVNSLYPVADGEIEEAETRSRGFKSLICWAVKADSSLEDIKSPTVFVPAALLRSHSNLFGRARPLREPALATLALVVTQPVALSSIILLSLSTDAYQQAVTRHSEEGNDNFEELVERHGAVLRSGQILSLGTRRNMTKWRVAMTEPVLQGVVRKGFTSFLVLPPAHSQRQSQLKTAVDEQDTLSEEDDQVSPDLNSEDEDEGSLDDDFEIDESFLANSVLTPTAFSPPSSAISSPKSKSALAGQSSFPLSPSIVAPTLQQSLITPYPLRHSIASPLLVPRPGITEDDVPRAYLKSKDLSRLGVFSGDWVITSCEGDLEQVPRKSRLVRVFASEGVVPEVPSSDLGIHAHFPPSFLSNLSVQTPAQLSLHPLRLSAPPVFPTAYSITVARVASPHSVHRAYQSLFLDGLKRYFQSKQRILNKGDIITVGICEEGARFGGKEDARVGDDEDIDFPVSSSSATAVVYFKITSLDLSPGATQALRIKAGTPEQIVLDRMAAGELGCLIDPQVTKMVQTGLERSLVPDVAGFLDLPDSTLVSTAPSRLGDPTPASRLYDYVSAALRPGASEYDLHLTVLLKGARGCGKKTIARTVARKTGFHLLELDCYELLGETDVKTEGHLRSRIDKAISCSPCIVLLRNLEALARKSQALETGQEPAMSTILKECFALAREGWKLSGFPIIIIATACDPDKIPSGVLAAFKEEISFEAPGEPERLAMLQSLTRLDAVAPDVSLRALAIQTAALVAVDLVDLVRRARSSATSRLLASTSSANTTAPVQLQDLQYAGMSLTSQDFNAALEKARSSYSESIGAPKIPNVTWDDVGGLANVKSDILDTIQLPLEHPELFADGLKKRSGILLYGPPGTGKTLLAKAVATSCSLNFFSIKGPELLNMYIGESEANVRRVFQRARDAKPCVIFFDELDSVAPKRGNQGDSGGVMDRIVSQLLAELDGMAEGKGGSDVFVIGATNRPDLLDPALLRPGRFDRMLYLGVSDNHDSQLKIIQALTRKFKLDPQIRLEDVASICPFNYTGADFYALCSDAMLKAMTRVAEAADSKIAKLNQSPPYSTTLPLTPQYYLAELAEPAELEVLVSQLDFEQALAELVPSVSKAEMLHYATIQSRFSGETMNSVENLEKKEVGGGLKQILNDVEEMVRASVNGNSAPEGKRKDKGKGKAVEV